jgi:hypothetical protein
MKKKPLTKLFKIIILNVIILSIVITLSLNMNIMLIPKTREVIFINSTVIKTEEFERSLPHWAEIVYLSKNRSGVEQISDYLKNKKGLDDIRIISHGNAGYFTLNGERIDNSYLAKNCYHFSSWRSALKKEGDIMLYGCNIAASEEGRKMVKTLAELTGADVAAATEEIGGKLKNWILDYSTGDIESAVLKINDYEYHLANITVTSKSDSGDGTLRQAITNAAAGDEITFNLSAGDETILLTSGQLAISKNLTIDGDNTSGSGTDISISGNHTSRIFNITGGAVTLQNLNLKEGHVGSGNKGGAIYHSGEGILSVDKCSITGNTGYIGGAIFNDDYSGYLTINNSTISGNTSDNNGGAIAFGYYSPSLTINNSVISNNSATGNGGAIAGDSGLPVSVTINNSSIINNSSDNYGGGLYQVSGTLTNCTISKNTAHFGGGISNMYLTLYNSIIWGNCATTNGNQFYNSYGTITLNYSCFANGTGDIYGPFTPDGHCITTDPKFVDPNNDFRIKGVSPCADAGNDSYNSEPNDIRGIGFGRKLLKINSTLSGPIDIGAYEFKNGTDPEPPVISRIYVDANATGTGDGTSWANAFTSLQSALTAAGSYCDIWVASGTYKPTTGSDRNASFQMKNGVAIYGGFTGTEISFNERDWQTNETILSGDLNGDDFITPKGSPILITNNSENSYHVVYNSSVNSTAILDGFTIQGGNATGNWPSVGGGIYNESSSPNIANCKIRANSAYMSGGGVSNTSN